MRIYCHECEPRTSCMHVRCTLKCVQLWLKHTWSCAVDTRRRLIYLLMKCCHSRNSFCALVNTSLTIFANLELINPNTQHGTEFLRICFPRGPNPPKLWSAAPPLGFEPRTCDTRDDQLPTTPLLSAMHGSVYFAKHIAWVHFFNEKLSRRVEQGVFQVGFYGIWDR